MTRDERIAAASEALHALHARHAAAAKAHAAEYEAARAAGFTEAAKNEHREECKAHARAAAALSAALASDIDDALYWLVSIHDS